MVAAGRGSFICAMTPGPQASLQQAGEGAAGGGRGVRGLIQPEERALVAPENGRPDLARYSKCCAKTGPLGGGFTFETGTSDQLPTATAEEGQGKSFARALPKMRTPW